MSFGAKWKAPKSAFPIFNSGPTETETETEIETDFRSKIKIGRFISFFLSFELHFIQKTLTMCRDGGIVVSILAFYSDDPSLNPATDNWIFMYFI